VSELVRARILGVARALFGRPTARAAALVLAQNPGVAATFAWHPSVAVEPNIALRGEGALPVRSADHSDAPVAVFAGRLLALKGLRLAFQALCRPEVESWHLHVYGEGPELRPLQRLAARRGLAERVTFFGHRPQKEVHAALADAQVMLFPSIRDAAGWAVAEAIEVGCPVVALDRGGPASIVGENDGVLVPVYGDVSAGLAAGLNKARGLTPRPGHWNSDRLADLLDGYYRRAVASGADANAVDARKASLQ